MYIGPLDEAASFTFESQLLAEIQYRVYDSRGDTREAEAIRNCKRGTNQ